MFYYAYLTFRGGAFTNITFICVNHLYEVLGILYHYSTKMFKLNYIFNYILSLLNRWCLYKRKCFEELDDSVDFYLDNYVIQNKYVELFFDYLDSFVVSITEPRFFLTAWLIYVCFVNPDNMTLFGVFNFLTDIHSGDHRHAYIYRYMCPVILYKEACIALGFLSSSPLFYLPATILFLWMANEIITNNRNCDSGTTSVYNILVSVNSINPFSSFNVRNSIIGTYSSDFMRYSNMLICNKYTGLKN